MPYVNERISDEDMLKYRIDEMAWGYAANRFRSWVIDGERDIYLREAYLDRENTEAEFWSFYWKGYQWPVYGFRVSYEPSTEARKSQKTMRFEYRKFPSELLSQIDQVQSDFKEAYCSDDWYVNTDVTFIFE
jgi:hypothetical protein